MGDVARDAIGDGGVARHRELGAGVDHRGDRDARLRRDQQHGGGVGGVSGVEGHVTPRPTAEPAHGVLRCRAVGPRAEVGIGSGGKHRVDTGGGHDPGAVPGEAARQVHREVAAQVLSGRDEVAGRQGGVPPGGFGRHRHPEPEPVTAAEPVGDRGCRGHVAVGHLQGLEDATLDVVPVAEAGCSFDDEPGQHEVRVGVEPLVSR